MYVTYVINKKEFRQTGPRSETCSNRPQIRIWTGARRNLRIAANVLISKWINTRLRQTCKAWTETSGIGVLGLAPCHVSENEIIGLQVRPAGQAGYPISLVASLDTVPVKCCLPLHLLTIQKGRSFTSVQMFHTHALTLSLTHTTLSHKLQHAALSHATLSHTSLSRTNLNTYKLPHTTLPHTTSHTHTILSHTAVHAKLFYAQLFHTLPFTHDSFTYNSFTTCLPPSPISFPILFSHLFWICWKKLACGVLRSLNCWIWNSMDHLALKSSNTNHLCRF